MTAIADTDVRDETTDEEVVATAETTSVNDTKNDESTDDSKADTDTTDKDTDAKDSDTDVETQAVDDSTAKKENRLGYQLRQIRTSDEFVKKLETNLTDSYVNEEGITDDQRSIRKLEAKQYVKDIAQARAQLVDDNHEVAREIPLFNPANKETFRKDLLDRSLARFKRDSLELDAEGQITGYKIRLLDYMREEADSYSVGSKTAKSDVKTDDKVDSKKGDDKKKTKKLASAQMDAASDEPGGASGTKTKSAEEDDPLLAAFTAGFDSVK